MKKALLFAAVAAFVFACGGSADNAAESSPKAPVAQAEAVDGSKIYKQYCVTCHGLYGDMGASGAFNLQTSQLTVPERVTVITNGREGTAMTAFNTLLSEEKIKAVAEFTLTLKKEE